jgi:hypothetical protein
VLIGHSWDDIANQIQDPSTDISKGVLGAANYLTAAICLATQNQPSSVCSANPIPQIEGSLPKASNSDNQLGLVANPLAMAVRQRK